MTDGEKINEFASLVRKSAECGTLVSVTFHSPVTGGEELKVKGRLCLIGGRSVCQTEAALTEGRVRQKNIQPEELEEAVAGYMKTFRKADLCDKNAAASLMISKKNAVTLIKKGNIGDDTAKEVECTCAVSNDRQKLRLLDGSESFLTALGVSDEKGRVHDKKQSKFRQICRFSEYIIEAEKKLTRNTPLCVCDLCCGKSYLSFAAYYVLTQLCGREVTMYCVDLKTSVIEYCAGIAEKCGMSGMKFTAGDVGAFDPGCPVDLVISLHACDIATDIVLDFAARHNARAVLSTPCCHHKMNGEMDSPELDFIARYPILRQKLASAATDSLRLLKLEAEGYKTDATELIDPEDTPKNVMLRAYRRSNFDPSSEKAWETREKYYSAYRFMYGKDPEKNSLFDIKNKPET